MESSIVKTSSQRKVYSRSGSDIRDEEALVWAAIERLPTFERIQRGVLATSKGSYEVNVAHLGLLERKALLDRLVKEKQAENEKFLLKLKQRIDRVGIPCPTVEVRFNHLVVEGERHVGSRAKASFLGFLTSIIEDVLIAIRVFPSKKKPFQILKDVSGVIKPARMTLLLGPPSSGKTTLLLSLSGRLDGSLKTTGEVSYNGHKFNEFVPERTAAYVSQHDDHTPEMTVRETFNFSALCQGVGPRFEMLAELMRREKEESIVPDPDVDIFMKAAMTGGEASVVTDYVIKILGLELCADTMVGDQMTRGISGGERKRVTTGEVLVGPAMVLFMDEISNGLDSSTTYEVVNCLRQYIHILEGTAVVSLLQPAPETFDLFDDIILLSDGKIVYQGPRQDALAFFEHVGFRCPPRKGVADFLQEVTSKKDQEQYWARRDTPYEFITADAFVEEFQSYSTGKTLADHLAVPFDKTKSNSAALTKTKYGATWQELLRITFAREWLLLKRGYFFFFFRMFQLTILGMLFMTVFIRTKMHKKTVNDAALYASALFFAVTVVVFNGMAEIPLSITKLPVFYKQRGFRFFPAWIYSLPSWIISIPGTIADTTVFTYLPYYVIGYDPSAASLFRQHLAFALLNQMGGCMFRAIGAVCRNLIVGNTLGSFVCLLLFLFGGYILPKGYLKPWWEWAYWTSPLMYGQNAIMANEFLGDSWNNVIPNSTMRIGVTFLKAKGFFTTQTQYWVGMIALVISIIVFNIVYTLALAFLSPYKTDRGTATEVSPVTNDSPPDKKRGMVLPFQPHTLTFDNIVYSVDMPRHIKADGLKEEKLVLLNEVSGAFRPGVLTALMGVSGAGKTTLMDVLAGRKTGGYIEGTITLSGYPKRQSTFARIAGYCEQNDIHSPNVSVYESLVYSAWLRLSPEIDAATRASFIEEIMELVELNPIRDAIVGLPGVGGLSTEQRKRLTIAVELVANPSIIFMDEPTTGLDARAAAIVMRTVRNTVDTGRTVICTIHQPSIDIFESFDELLLLKRGGEVIYAGPLGHNSSHLISYFEEIEGVSTIREGHNPADWMLEMTTPSQENELGVNFAEHYKQSDLQKNTKSLIKDLSNPPEGSKDLHFDTKYAQPFISQCLACLWKQHRSYWCNPSYTAVRFLFTAFIALVFGTVFWGLGSKTNTQQDLANVLGSIFASSLFLGIQHAFAVQPIVHVERTVFYRERAAGMYSSLPYAFGQCVIELPYVLAQALLFTLIVYSMMSLEWAASKFLWYFFFLFFTLLYFTYYGMTTVAVAPTLQTATIIATAFFGLWILFSGFVISRPETPVWWRWQCYITPLAWSLYGTLTSQYGNKTNMLETGQTVSSFINDHFGYEETMVGPVAAIVVGFTVAFVFIFASSIKHLNYQAR